MKQSKGGQSLKARKEFRCIGSGFYNAARKGKRKVKVKFTLEQATKAQRGSSGVAILFL